jgi:excisionase family DNA binding protein
VLTLAEAAKRLNLSPETLRWQVRNGKLKPLRKIAGAWVVSEREVERYRKEHLR